MKLANQKFTSLSKITPNDEIRNLIIEQAIFDYHLDSGKEMTKKLLAEITKEPFYKTFKVQLRQQTPFVDHLNNTIDYQVWLVNVVSIRPEHIINFTTQPEPDALTPPTELQSEFFLEPSAIKATAISKDDNTYKEKHEVVNGIECVSVAKHYDDIAIIEDYGELDFSTARPDVIHMLNKLKIKEMTIEVDFDERRVLMIGQSIITKNGSKQLLELLEE